jgi:hypothetical protein
VTALDSGRISNGLQSFRHFFSQTLNSSHAEEVRGIAVNERIHVAGM